MRNWIFRVILVMLPLGWPGLPFANIAFYHFGVEKGLPETQIVSISQDSTGFIWLAGANGMFRFDGSQFKAYQNSFFNTEQSSFSIINSLFTDSRGTLWVGANNGVSTYDFIHDRFIKPSGNWNRYRATDFDEDEHGNIWIATNHGLIAYHPESGETLWFTGSNGQSQNAILPDTEIHKITCQPGGKIWFTLYRGGLFQFEPESGTVRDFSNVGEIILGTMDISELGFSENHLFVSTISNGIFWFNPEEEKAFQETFDNLGLTVRHFRFSDDSLVWLATNNGLIRSNYLSGEYTQYINEPTNSLSMNRTSVNYVFLDNDKNIWVSSGIRGVDYGITGNPFYQFNIDEVYPYSLYHKEVTAIHFDEQGNMWLGYEAGLVEQHTHEPLGRNRFHLTSKSQSGAPGSIMAIFEDSKNRVWIGGWDCGLQKLNAARTAVEYAPILPEEMAARLATADIRGMAEDSRGNLWISFHGIGLGRYNPETYEMKLFHHDPENPFTTLSNDYPFNLCFDNHDNLWVATAHGVTKLSLPDEQITTYFAEDDNRFSLSSSTVNTIYCDVAGTVWAGTSTGLNMYNQALDVFEPVLTDREIPFISISDIQSINPGEIWVSTFSGIFQVTYPLDFSGDNIRVNSQLFDRSSGLLSTSYFQRSSGVSTDGMIFFGGNEGIDFFNPNEVRSSKSPDIKTLITELRVDGQPVYPVRDKMGTEPVVLSLDYRHRMINIRFTALHFNAPGALRFRYKMEGLDDEWFYPQVSQSATFSNLKSGTYRFMAEVQYKNGPWSSPAVVIIRVKPAFWTTIPFIVFLLFIFAGLIWFAFWYRSRVMFIRQKKLEQIIAEDTRELQQKNDQLEQANQTKNKFFSIISHDLRSPFSGLVGILEVLTDSDYNINQERQKELLQTAKKSARQTFDLLDNLLTWSRSQMEKTNIFPKTENLSNILKNTIELKQAAAQQKEISIKRDFPEDIEAFFDVDMINVVARNLLGNAIKYTPQGGEITVVVESKNGMAFVHIADSGIGLGEEEMRQLFDLNKKSRDGTQGEKGTGLGLVICKEFIERNYGKIWVTPNRPKGTVFHFSIPLQEI